MLRLTDTQREHIIELLEKNKDLPPDYKHLLFPPERQEYELVYAGKEREEDILAETMGVPLQPIRSFGGNGDGWHNMLIFGDNLQAMKTLWEMKKQGKLVNADGSKGVRLVYIDPPFATKQEFKGSKDQKAYQDKITGAKFLEFLRKRLLLLRELLSENGSIYVHLDQRKGHYVKILMDELFEEHNFLNDISWCYKEREISKTNWNEKHDHILFYKKNGTALFNWQAVTLPYSKGTVKKYTLYR